MKLFEKLNGYSYLLERFEFRWHFGVAKYGPNIWNFHLFDWYLLLNKHFLRPWPPDRDCALAISREDSFVVDASKTSTDGSKHTENWFVE